MNNPMTFWYCAVTLVLLAFFIQFLTYLFSRRDNKEHGSLFGHIKERDMFYIPGDNRFDDEDDDFDDL